MTLVGVCCRGKKKIFCGAFPVDDSNASARGISRTEDTSSIFTSRKRIISHLSLRKEENKMHLFQFVPVLLLLLSVNSHGTFAIHLILFAFLQTRVVIKK